jgi:hypothetical protein
MIRAGVLPEDSTIELLDGLLVYRDRGDANWGPGMASGPDHDLCIANITALIPQLNTGDRHMRVQSGLRLSGSYTPVPDAFLLRGGPRAYAGRLPSASDVLCLIEVADSSYARDAGEKLAAYAAAGVPQYVILDLRRRLAEVYGGPDTAAGTYSPPLVVMADGALPLRVGDGETVAVPLAELLP